MGQVDLDIGLKRVAFVLVRPVLTHTRQIYNPNGHARKKMN